MSEPTTRTITLLTDFGPKDSFIGIMKGVITSIAPGTMIIDLCHEVGQQDVIEAGFLLSTSYSFFPPGTIHVVVVDPGVGTDRAILAMEARGYFFLVPDNGVIVPVVGEASDADKIVKVENDAYFLKPVSTTFHGRDVFAAVAAHIAKGVPLDALGPEVSGFATAGFPRVEERRLPEGKRELQGEIIHIDHFGNLVTNIPADRLSGHVVIKCGEAVFPGLKKTYADAGRGVLLALEGSSGFMEIAANQANAQELLGVGRGKKVYIEMS